MEDFPARVRAMFPMTATRCSLELVDIEVRDAALRALVQLIVRDDNDAIRDIKEQDVYLLPERHWNERGLAFVVACKAAFAASVPETVETLMPHDLFPCALLDVPDLPLERFAAVLDDPRTRRIIDVRPDDAALLATIGKPAPASAHDPALEARCEDAASFAVYGDWLAERGDPRGELIAVQLGLEVREDRALRERELELLHLHAYAWLRELAWSPDTRATFRRGFLHAIAFRSPDNDLSFVDGGWEIRELAELPATRFLQRVEIGPKGIWDDAAFEAIGEVGLPPSVTSVAIATGDTSAMGELTAALPGMANVRQLRLESRGLTLDGLALPALRDLELATRGLTRDNLASLREAELKLDRLVLWLGQEGVDDCDVELDDLDWILAGGRGLRELGLCGRDVVPVLERVIAAPILRELRVLDVAGSYLDASSATWVREHHAAFAHLERLIVPASLEPPPVIAPNVVADDRFIPVYE